jgi:hypothetical protein
MMLSNIFCNIHIENSCDHCKIKGFKKFSLETVRDISDYEGGLIQVKVDDLEDFLNNDERVLKGDVRYRFSIDCTQM